MLRKRIERLEVIDGVGAARVIVVVGPVGLDVHGTLADRDLLAQAADLVIVVGKPEGATTTVTVDGKLVG